MLNQEVVDAMASSWPHLEELSVVDPSIDPSIDPYIDDEGPLCLDSLQRMTQLKSLKLKQAAGPEPDYWDMKQSLPK